MATDAHFPIFLNVDGRSCLVIGGGPMAAGRVVDLLDCGGRIHVVSPVVVSEIEELAERGRIRWSRRRPELSDISDAFITFASDEKVGQESPISYRDLEEYREVADRHGRLFNAIDHRDLCLFTTPSVARKVPLVVAISTGGTSPVLGTYLRNRIMEEVLTDEFAAFARFLGRYRKRLRSLLPDYAVRRDFYQNLIDLNFVAFLRNRQEEEALSELIRLVAEKRREVGYEEARL